MVDKNGFAKWGNLAPGLPRQRLIMESTTPKIPGPEAIKEYLSGLAKVTGMTVVSGPFAYSAHEMGYGAWIHWKSSGPTSTVILLNRLFSQLTLTPASHSRLKALLNSRKSSSGRLNWFGRK